MLFTSQRYIIVNRKVTKEILGDTMRKIIIFLLLFLPIPLYVISASRPAQEELNPDVFDGFSKEEYLDFIVKNIVSGGVERDDIPPIDFPDFISADNADFIKEKDAVIGAIIEGRSYAFPKKILYWHEIVNYELNGKKYSVTFCPLTGSAIGFLGRNLGISGKLFNNNLVMYDRETNSNIPQILGTGIDGVLKGVELKTFPTVFTTWGKWKEVFPDTSVLTLNTGYSRNYNRSPYPGYEEALRFWFPVSTSSDRFHAKEIMIGFKFDGNYYAVQKKEFIKKKKNSLQTYDLNGKKIKIIYQERLGNLEVVEVFQDTGKEIPVHNFEVFWFAWYAYFPSTTVLE